MAAIWDPVQQIYTGGNVPGCDDAAIYAMMSSNNKDTSCLYVFGYGSLCWNPSGTLQTVLCRGRALGHRRVWAQKSTDHRGRPGFPGIVCTLLTTDEYMALKEDQNDDKFLLQRGTNSGGGVLGVVYTVPQEHVQECLEELDFREKGGYAREIISVVREDTGETISCLLYRGTLDNPAFWPRAAVNLPLAASVMAVASGPSGENHVYLRQLAEFLESHTTTGDHDDDEDDTLALFHLVQQYISSENAIHFLSGCGSNQHGQLLPTSMIPSRTEDEDLRTWTEVALHLPSQSPIQDVYAGGGHSAARTADGQLFLWGWNEQNQCGNSNNTVKTLPNIRVASAALGFSHTMVIEMETRRLFGFGDDRRGQVSGEKTQHPQSSITTPKFLLKDRIQQVAAGLFHSAVATESGHVVIISDQNHSRWKPPDANIVQVACGGPREWTVALDSRGRLWTASLGNHNKYGQLGRRPTTKDTTGSTTTFGLVQGLEGCACIEVQCGWSHAIALVEAPTTIADQKPQQQRLLYGWGRNDKGQLGTGSAEHQPQPVLLDSIVAPKRVFCGSESSVVLLESGEVHCCGWNEHGNLGFESTSDCSFTWESASKLRSTLLTQSPNKRLVVAAGGAHVLAMQVPMTDQCAVVSANARTCIEP